MSINVSQYNPQAFTELAAKNFAYDWERGPQQVRNVQDAEQGLNCVAFNHLLFDRLFGVQLPPDLHGNEMLMDLHSGSGTFFRPVPGLHLARPGDVIFLGLDRPGDAQRRFSPQYDNDGFMRNSVRSGFRHVVGVTNLRDPATDELLVTDISRNEGARIASLAEVSDVEDRCSIYGIGRLLLTSRTESIIAEGRSNIHEIGSLLATIEYNEGMRQAA